MSLSYSGNIYTRSRTDNGNFEVWKCHNGIRESSYMNNGYICFQNGLTFQWQKSTANYTYNDVAAAFNHYYPIAFGHYCLIVIAPDSFQDAPNAKIDLMGYGTSSSYLTKEYVTLYKDATTWTFSFFALGI